MIFKNPAYLQLLWGGLGLLLLLIWRFKRNKKYLRGWVSQELETHNIPLLNRTKVFVFGLIVILAYMALVIAIAEPHWGKTIKKEMYQAHDIIVALDVSKSMLAEDLKPNRLERAKLSLKNLIRRRSKDRFGIILFAGSAAVQLPLTTDKAAADMLTDDISTESISVGGTNISSAIERAIIAFGEPGPANRALIIMTDGEDHEPMAVEKAKEALINGIRIFTIGIGKPEGIPIPLYVNGQFRGYRADENGRTIVTRLNEANLKDIASAGGGKYVNGNDLSRALDIIGAEIDKLEATEREKVSFSAQNNNSDYFVMLAYLLLLLDLAAHKTKLKHSFRKILFFD